MAGITAMTYIIIIFIVMIIIKKAGKQGNHSKDQSERILNEYYKKTASGENAAQSGAREASGIYSPMTQRPADGYSRMPNPAAGNVVAGKANMPANSSAATAPDEQGKSTTEYLTEKARRDRVEHAKEKLEERRNIQKKYGNRPVGGRYLLGDPVPRGMRLTICPYCAAENIVEVNYHGGKDCYFCRTKLPH